MELMPGDSKHNKPKRKLTTRDIKDARYQDNVALLRAAGKKGAEKSAEVQREKKINKAAEDEYWDEKAKKEAEEDARKLRESTNEDILPVDPENEAE
jgi:hypothetical protein